MLVKKIQNSRFYGANGTTTEMLVREPVLQTFTETVDVSSPTPPAENMESDLNVKEPYLPTTQPTMATEELSKDVPVVNNNTTNVEYNIETRPLLLERTPITKDEVPTVGGGSFGGGFGGGGGGGAVEEEIIAPKKKSKWWLWLLVAGGVYGISKMKMK